MPSAKILIVGCFAEEHVGAHLLRAADELSVEARFVDLQDSWSSCKWVNRFWYHCLGHRPVRLSRFSRRIVRLCREFNPGILLVTGIAAPSAPALQAIGTMPVFRANFLTDDPWNPKNGANFFWDALKSYDVVYSPRTANLDDLIQHGCRRVQYLPFAYNPGVHYPEEPVTDVERGRFACDVAIVGGADGDRVPVAQALADAGLNLKLYGGYWDRWPSLKPYWQGFAVGRELRLAVSRARVHVCLVRRANRDGHAMRSLELPAMKACLVAEDTVEHRELFGEDGACVEYYTTIPALLSKVKGLCGQPARCRLMGAKVYERICQQGRHTYTDRLRQILERSNVERPPG